MFPGVGLYACPVKTKAEESLVQVPLLGDRPNVCSELKPVDSFISRLWLPDFVFDTSGGWGMAGVGAVQGMCGLRNATAVLGAQSRRHGWGRLKKRLPRRA
jgi:hypothetical protein